MLVIGSVCEAEAELTNNSVCKEHGTTAVGRRERETTKKETKVPQSQLKVGLEPSKAELNCVLDREPERDQGDRTALYRAVISDTPARERERGRKSEGEKKVDGERGREK